jgi:benzoyl-CoA reductase/2-hydroxyglutaryl-CoA dehydratase subunit BcrC/BadD/HgdB
MPAAAQTPRRSEVLRAQKERGGLVAAVLPIHYPRALLRAFNILPIEVWGPPGVESASGAAHVQPYVCSIVRNALSFLETGGLDATDLILVPHGCDSLQGLASILIDFVHPRQPVIPLYIPRATSGNEIEYLAEEFRSVYRRLEKIAQCSPSDSDLIQSIRREEEADGMLAQLHGDRNCLPFGPLEFYRLIRSREYLPAERFSELAQPALRLKGEVRQDGIPIVLSGLVPEPMAVLGSIAEIGGRVVADDLACCGRRLYPAGTSTDPFQHMAESLLGGPPDSTRGSSIPDRLQHLRGLVASADARGVIFYDVKFCEPELFALPDLRKGLQESGTPSVVIEVDLNDPLSHQVVTRIEAFLEMVA